jgi:hypothetical protein
MLRHVYDVWSVSAKGRYNMYEGFVFDEGRPSSQCSLNFVMPLEELCV